MTRILSVIFVVTMIGCGDPSALHNYCDSAMDKAVFCGILSKSQKDEAVSGCVDAGEMCETDTTNWDNAANNVKAISCSTFINLLKQEISSSNFGANCG